MLTEFWTWLQQPSNLAAVGGILFVVWTVFIYFFPTPDKLYELKIWRDLQLKQRVFIRTFIWLVGLVLLLGGVYYVILSKQPVLLVCEGEFEQKCPRHDRHVGCYEMPNLIKSCWYYKELAPLSEAMAIAAAIQSIP